MRPLQDDLLHLRPHRSQRQGQPGQTYQWSFQLQNKYKVSSIPCPTGSLFLDTDAKTP